jgi:putative transposase
LIDDHVRTALRKGIQEVRQSLPFSIDAWILLPDHLHAIWTLPENDDNFGSRWAVIKRTVSRQCGCLAGNDGPINESPATRGESGIWQRRFWDHLFRQSGYDVATVPEQGLCGPTDSDLIKINYWVEQ